MGSGCVCVSVCLSYLRKVLLGDRLRMQDSMQCTLPVDSPYLSQHRVSDSTHCNFDCRFHNGQI